MPLVPSEISPNPGGVFRDDAWPPEGGPPGSSYELMREQLLEPLRVERGLLTFGGGTYVAAIANPYLAAEVARAANDWSLDRWLDGGDERLYGTALVANQLPEEAAKEIRRIGGHPRIAAALMATNGIGKPFGHPLFHPIYEAAVEMDLPVAIHAAGESFASMRVSPVASGVPSLYLEHHTLLPQGVMTHLVSLLVHGVFERFPALRVLLIEAGVAWIPAVLWRFDMDYRGLRRETPWLRRHPSEYFYDHVRITTQPLELAPRREQLIDLLRLVEADRVLCFSSDYPHWDTDEVDHVARHLPAEWHERVFRGNAIELFGWDGGAPV
jgi:predicted TIM-barrel fold metal-dependent hydrolase